MIVIVQTSFQTTWASPFEMELEPNSLDWNGNELEHELELEDMKRTNMTQLYNYFSCTTSADGAPADNSLLFWVHII